VQHHIKKIPEYFKHLPPDACLNVKEMADLYGVAQSTIYNWAAKHWLPEPKRVRRLLRPSCTRILLWPWGEIKKHFLQELAGQHPAQPGDTHD
jgi:predicted DNA-binding transcriptional regulator AlpA